MYLARLAASWLVILSATLAAPGGASPDLAAGQPEVFKLEREPHGRLTIPVTIGDEGPYRFMVDTGAQVTVLSSRLADQLGLKERNTATMVGMTSSARVETVAIENLELGSRRFDIARAAIVPSAQIGEADGILGLDSIRQQKVLLDFGDNTITFADGREMEGDGSHGIVVDARHGAGQLVIGDARLNGVRTAIIIDTGAYDSVGNTALLERLRRSRDLGAVELIDVNGERLRAPARLGRELKIGKARVRNVPIVFSDVPPFEILGLTDEPALIIGMRELKRFRRVSIDFPGRRIVFGAPRSFRADALSDDRFGV